MVAGCEEVVSSRYITDRIGQRLVEKELEVVCSWTRMLVGVGTMTQTQD